MSKMVGEYLNLLLFNYVTLTYRLQHCEVCGFRALTANK